MISLHPPHVYPHLSNGKNLYWISMIVEDEIFIEKRRRGLLRYMNYLMRHPIMRTDEAIRVFLTDKEVGRLTVSPR